MSTSSSQTALRVSDWGRVAFSLFLAAGVHACWLLMDLSSPEPGDPAPLPQVVAFSSQTAGGWSPTLFSLPSLTGFSGAMRDQSLQSAPPLVSPLRLTEDIRYERNPPEMSLPELDAGRVPFSDSVLSRVTGEAEPSGLEPGWQLSFPDGNALEVEWSRVPAGVPEDGGFELVGEISFDESGRVSSLLLHPPLPEDPVTSEAMQTLRRIRSLEEKPSQQVRFRYRYQPQPMESQ